MIKLFDREIQKILSVYIVEDYMCVSRKFENNENIILFTENIHGILLEDLNAEFSKSLPVGILSCRDR